MDVIFSNLSLVFDIVITLLLGATIFFAIKLSRHLDAFRSNRSNMENLIRELSTQITRAQEGISELDEMSASRGDELRRSISKAQALIDELDVMVESGDSLAKKLEAMATRNREIVDEIDTKTKDMLYPAKPSTPRQSTTLVAEKRPRYEDTLAKASITEDDASPFAIRDPDYNGDGESYGSKAERELAEALKKRTQK